MSFVWNIGDDLRDPDHRLRARERAAVRRKGRDKMELARIANKKFVDKRNASKTRSRIHNLSISIRRYGISKEIYESTLVRQGGNCAICLCKFGEGRRPHIDHDHSCCPASSGCGKCFRGLLCRKCNTGIGLLMDDASVMLRAVGYIKNWKTLA